MNKTILYIATSLDGYVSGQGDDISWLNRYADIDYGYNEFYATVGSIIMGRKTFDIISKNFSWPYNVPTIVLTSKPIEKIPENAQIFISKTPQEAHTLAAQKSQNLSIWITGGAKTAQSFLDLGLVDEIVLSLAPVLLGSGTRLFENKKHTDLKLFTTKTFERDLVQLVYRK